MTVVMDQVVQTEFVPTHLVPNFTLKRLYYETHNAQTSFLHLVQSAAAWRAGRFGLFVCACVFCFKFLRLF